MSLFNFINKGISITGDVLETFDFSSTLTNMLNFDRTGGPNDSTMICFPSDLMDGNTPKPFVHIRAYDALNKTSSELCNIFLYMPQISIEYNQKWEPFNDTIEMIDTAIHATGEVMHGDFSTVADYGRVFIEKTTQKLSDKYLKGANVGQSISEKSKQASNPLQSFGYKGPDFRTFSLKFDFIAKNAKESEDIYKIIMYLKYLMHPDGTGGTSSAGSRFWIYPDDWQVDLYNGISANAGEALFRFKRSLCTKMSVDYGVDNINSFFKNTGAPVMCSVTLEFTEKTILEKEDILNGY